MLGGGLIAVVAAPIVGGVSLAVVGGMALYEGVQGDSLLVDVAVAVTEILGIENTAGVENTVKAVEAVASVKGVVHGAAGLAVAASRMDTAENVIKVSIDSVSGADATIDTLNVKNEN